MKLKYLKCLLFLCLMPSSVSAQKIVFQYDACGNTVSKKQARTKKTSVNAEDDSYTNYERGNYIIKLGPSPTTGLVSGHIVDFEGTYTITAYDPRTNQMITRSVTDNFFSINISNFSRGYVIITIKINDNEVLESIKIIKK